MALETIKEAIKHLPEEERRKLAGWFEGLEEASGVSEGHARLIEKGLAKVHCGPGAR
jgi:hypothetical protein